MGTIGDILSEKVVDGKKYLFRSSAKKDSNRMFLLSCYVESENYHEVKEGFLMAIKSFTIANQTRLRFAEPMKFYYFDKPIKGKFLFPVSWTKKKGKSPSKEESSYSFLNKNILSKKLSVDFGSFHFAAISHKDAETFKVVYQRILDSMKDNGIKIDKKELEKQTNKNTREL